MDPHYQNLANFRSHPFKMTSNLMHNGAAESMIQIEPLGLPFPRLQMSSGVKRKFGLIYGAEGQHIGSSLSLGLGHSLSSSDSKGSSATVCTVASSSKETDAESSRDFGFEFDLNLGYEKIPALEKEKPASLPEIDLELSLYTGSPESEITEISSGPPTVQVRKELMPPLPTAHMFQNLSSSSAGTTTSSTVSCTSGITKKLRSSNTKTCQVEGCKKGARGASGRCISHGGGRRCQRTGCPKGAEGRTPYCKAHGGGRRCEYLGCTKSAEGRTDFCIGHGGGRRCGHDGCTKAARGKSGLCIRHGGGKRCRKDGCSRSAEGLSGLCISHGGGRRCQFPGGCSKGAQGSTAFCKAHGGGKRCTYPGCGKGAEGSTPFCKGHGGGKRCLFEGGGVCTKSVHGGTNFCVAHGGGKRCAVPECTRSARGKTAFCVRHGGGKRCTASGCEKSAQGSTDFCKAHGSGKGCSWGHSRNIGDVPCTAFARGRTGLCALHNSVVQDKRVHGGAVVAPIVGELVVKRPRKTNESALTADDASMDLTSNASDAMTGFEFQSSSQYNARESGFFPAVSQVTVPEGRVHGGSLMAILNGGSSLGHPDSKESPMTPQAWI
ncbi:uncharacterized protein LOC116203773 [Punica granatum]|uniref:WRKY19-like zinc finger domain-containing protein n=2 Tax=Punica granatum TaxID=22663 RepID=A0A218XKC1_PUNGR|nr:uncharacterized protein LOC116203773 [Punica granatum]OWM85268.1 hypothetical protein CDL15_Pgr028055 [Punica granatum]PKI46281.1 hypothetical protein CRG98_033333 [Punica granatum]